MRRRALAGLLLLISLISSNCNHEHSPTSPTIPPTSTQPPSNQNGLVWGYVFDSATGGCLQGATVEVIAGPHIGQQSFQKDCDFDIGQGYSFVLPAGESLTLRASAPGYTSQEKSDTVSSGGSGQFNFSLMKQ